MSKFFQALEQAKRDRALRGGPPPLAEAPPPRPEHSATLAVAAPSPSSAAEITLDGAGSSDGVDEHLVSLVTPAAFEAEQYRSLRHTIEHLHRTAVLKVIAVSSPSTGDGKTTTAINLAGSLAQSPEARVLLIDADLRRPALGHLLGLGHSGQGLVDAILDPNLDLDRVVEPRPPFNLSVLCAGQLPPSPYEVLKSPRLGVLLDAARRDYDFVVIDTPPLTPIQDCRVIGRWVDGFLLVIAAHRTPRKLVEEALTTLDPAKMLGIVFNQDDRSIAHHYSNYYGGPSSPGQPSLDASAPGAFRRVALAVGASLRPRRRRASQVGAGRFPGERR
jgi:capsular exopolysaccharide synthesis family protein